MKQRYLALVLACVLLACNNEKMEDIVVIGGGLMGSAAGWQLSNAGARVLVLEQQDSVYTYGSSFGESRISRSLGPQGDLFSYLQQTSVAETHKLIEFLNSPGRPQRHSMEDIYTTAPVTYIFGSSQEELVADLLKGQNDPYEYASSPSEALALFGMTVPDSLRIIRETKPYSGTMNPAVLIAKLHEGIKLAGSRVRYNEKVTRLQRVRDYYRIVTTHSKTGETHTIRAKKVVSAAGPYSGGLLSDLAPYFDRLVTTKRLFLVFFKPDKSFWESLKPAQKSHFKASFPAAEMDSEIFYAMLDHYDEDGIPIIKAGGHFLRTDITDPDKAWELPVTMPEQKWAESHILDYLSYLGFPCSNSALDYYKGYSCVYSLTASEIPYVTRIPYKKDSMDPNVVVIAGLSGVGAKGALAYGLHAADLLLGRDNTNVAYQKASMALGEDRFLEDKAQMEGRNAALTSDSANGSVMYPGNPMLADGSIFFRRD